MGRVSAEETREGVQLTHLDQPLADGTDLTKRELVDYLDVMSDRLVPVLAGRPLSVIRVRPGSEPFMQKNLPKQAPDWVRRAPYWVQRSKRTVTYPVCDDRRTLLWLANQRALELHPTLFRLDAEGGETPPTHLVLDIDPPEGADFAVVKQAAELVRRALEDHGLSAALKTSGAKGVHLFAPLEPTETERVAAAARALAAYAERLDPEVATTAFVREERGGRVFLDTTRAGGATVAAAYSPRARPGWPVSFPVAWDDLADLDPGAATIRTAPGLLAGGDPWAELMPAPQDLPDDLVEAGRLIPVARVQAMHEGKRRARERRSQDQPDP